MFNRKQEKIDELNARNIELARQLRGTKLENNQLRQIRLMEVRNNTKILEQNKIKTDLIKRITNLVDANKHNNEKAVLDKIKELISDYHSQN